MNEILYFNTSEDMNESSLTISVTLRYKDETLLSSSDQTFISHDDTITTLTLKRISLQNSGIYSCVTSYKLNKVVTECSLHVAGKPLHL